MNITIDILDDAQKIAFTGGIYAHDSGARISRKQVEEMICDIGKIPVSDANKADLLVIGSIRGETTKKLSSAENIGIPIIHARDFIEAYHLIVQENI